MSNADLPWGKSKYIGWELTERSRNMLLGLYLPKYKRVLAHHVTYKFGTNDPSLIPEVSKFQVVGYVCDGYGIEGLVISIDGNTKREDGSTYHITWSLDPATHKPVQTNNVLKEKGFEPFAVPINIEMVPKSF